MPCFDGRENTAATSLAEENRKLRRRLDNVTRVACELARWYRNSNKSIMSLSVDTRQWIREHEAFDRSRSNHLSKK